MDQKFYLADNVFSDKLEKLQKKLRSRMNGEASSQMSRLNSNYTINYGLALPQIKEISTLFEFTDDELRKLWRTDIREAMIIVAMKFSEPEADEMFELARGISTPDMVEQASFFLFWRTKNVEVFVRKLLTDDCEFSVAIAYFTMGNLLKKVDGYNEVLCCEMLEKAMEMASFTICEMRGLSLFLRQLVRKGFSKERISDFLCKIEQIPTPEARSLVEEVKNEMEFLK